MLRPPTLIAICLGALGLFGALSCGGGGSPAPPPPPPKTIADTLSYSDPSTGLLRLMRDPSSTPSRLLLNLVGTTGTSHGVAMVFQVPPGVVSWSPLQGNSLAQNLAFAMGSDTPLTQVRGNANGQLQMGFFQKPKTVAPVNLSQPLLRFALDLKPNTPVNTSVSITFVKGQILQGDGALVDLPLEQMGIGALRAN